VEETVMWSSQRLFCAFAIVVGSAWVGLAIAADLASIEYSIALSAKEYLEGQDVIVISTIKNVSDKPIETLEPRGRAWSVTFDVREEGADGEWRSVVEPWWVPDGSGYSSRVIALAPGETRTQSCEIGYQLEETLAPGEYVLEAKYHPIEPGVEGYDSEVVVAKGVPFRVVPVGVKEKAWLELSPKLVGMDSPIESKRAAVKKELVAFIEQHPKSVFLPQAYGALSTIKWQEKDYIGHVDILEAWRNTPVSTDQRDHLVFSGACALIKAGEYDAALALAKLGTSEACDDIPVHVKIRKQQKAEENRKKEATDGGKR
jgi:hypothetical protein